MSKRTSKLSRKCASKNTQSLIEKYMNKSSDDFEDDAKQFTRNTIKNIKNSQNVINKSVTSRKNIRSVLREFSVDNNTKKEAEKLKAFDISNDVRTDDVLKSLDKEKDASIIYSSENVKPNNNAPTKIIDKNDAICKVSDEDDSSAKHLSEASSKNNRLTNLDDVHNPPCPLCGKEFRTNKANRTAHLKECGSVHGMRTEDLIKVRRLEEKQAAEWIALGLPTKVLPHAEPYAKDKIDSSNCQKENPAEGNVKKSKKKRKPDSKIVIESSNDPNLEMALALSASLAQKKAHIEIKSEISDNKSDQCSNLENVPVPNEHINQLNCPSTNDKKDDIPDIIMPTASCWWKKTSPISTKQFIASKKGCNRKIGKTKLESMTDEERSSKISEEVARILSGTERFSSETKLNSTVINENGKDFHFFSSPQRQNLRQQWKNKIIEGQRINQNDCSKNLWEKSQSQNIIGDYYIEAFEKYKLECKPKKQQKNSDKTEIMDGNKSTNIDLNEVNGTCEAKIDKLAQDFESFFESGSKSDLTIYSKNEEPLQCNTIILYARCKKILDDVVRQKAQSGQEEDVICWNSYDYCVTKKLIRYLYCGKLPNDIKSATEWKQHKELSNYYEILEYKNHINKYDKTKFSTEVENENGYQNPHETTGGFLENENLNSLKTIAVDDDNVGGTTQNLDLLLNEFDANSSYHINDANEVEIQHPNVPVDEKDLDEEDWNDVHEYLTQKPPPSILDETSEINLSSTSVTTPIKLSTHESVTTQVNDYSQQSRSDSPDMFADEDDCNQVTGITSTPSKNSKSFDDTIEDLPLSQISLHRNKSELEGISDQNQLSFPISASLNDFTKTIETSIGGENEQLSFKKDPNPKETSYSIKNQITETKYDEEIPKLSTPIDFSDNENFDDIYLETENHYSLVQTPEKPNTMEKDISNPVSDLVQDNRENTLSCRILNIRSKLKTIDSTSIKNIEILLQELLSMYDITVETLIQTGIGKTVKQLSETCKSETVKRKAGLLVSRWTLLVNQHVESQETEYPNTREAQRTPESKCNRMNNHMITPKPDYEAMVTPAIHNELKKYGIRNMSKIKAIPLLDHIYKETHPIVNNQQLNSDIISNLDRSIDAISTTSNESADHELMEESILLTNQCDTLSQSLSQPIESNPDVNLRDLVVRFIQSDKELYNKCLMYEPFWLEQFFNDFKPFALAHNLNSKQFNLKLVTDILDNECLTFRTGASANRNRNVRKKNPKNRKLQSSSIKRKGKKRLSSTQVESAPTKKRGRKNLYATQS